MLQKSFQFDSRDSGEGTGRSSCYVSGLDDIPVPLETRRPRLLDEVRRLMRERRMA